MKSIEIKALITLLVITMSLSASIKRENKSTSKTARKSKAKTGTGSDGKGTWVTEYDCPFVEVLDSQNRVVETTQRYTFKPTQLTGAEGFKFVMDGDMKPQFNRFVKVNSLGEKYIPWRFFDKTNYKKKTGSYKMIVANVRNDAGEKTTLQFNLPWAFWTTYISADQVNNLKYKIIVNSSNEKNLIQGSKQHVEYASNLLENYQKAKDLRVGNEQAMKKKLEENIVKNQALLVERRAAMKAIDDQISTQRPTITQLNAQHEEINSQIISQDQIYENNLFLIDDNQRNTKFAAVDQKITTVVENITFDIQNLQKSCGNYNFDLITQASSKGNFDELTRLLLGVKPIN